MPAVVRDPVVARGQHGVGIEGESVLEEPAPAERCTRSASWHRGGDAGDVPPVHGRPRRGRAAVAAVSSADHGAASPGSSARRSASMAARIASSPALSKP